MNNERRRDFAKMMIEIRKEDIKFWRNMIAKFKTFRKKYVKKGWNDAVKLLDENIRLAEKSILKEKDEIRKYMKKM